MSTLLCNCLRKVSVCPLRCTQNGWLVAASMKKTTAPGKTSVKSKAVRQEFEVEKDPYKLHSHLCGGNIYKEGEDPALKPTEEYPAWLWDLHIRRRAPDPSELEYDSFEYWQRVKKISLREKNAVLSQKRNRKFKRVD